MSDIVASEKIAELEAALAAETRAVETISKEHATLAVRHEEVIQSYQNELTLAALLTERLNAEATAAHAKCVLLTERHTVELAECHEANRKALARLVVFQNLPPLSGLRSQNGARSFVLAASIDDAIAKLRAAGVTDISSVRVVIDTLLV